MRRIIGDIYTIHLQNNRVGFMQHIANDESQLGSNVVRVFGIIQANDSPVDLDAIAQSEVRFYAHVLLKAGETLSIWEKIGRINKVSASIPLWCQCNESDRTVPVSRNWVVWRTNGARTSAVLDSKDFLDAELGDAFSPINVQSRLTDGKYVGAYPRKPT